MFGLRLFRWRAREVHPELRVAVLRGLLEAHHAGRSPQETLNELMRLGNQELRREGWLQANERQQAAGSSEKVDEADSIDPTRSSSAEQQIQDG
jgi:hypothetical protein